MRQSALKTRRLFVEALEDRQLLAAGGALVAQVVNLSVPTLDILPGGQNKILSALTVSPIGRQYLRLTEVLAVSASGSEPLAWNAQNLSLKADLNGKASDGCEAVIASARADYWTDLVDFNVTRPVWVTKPLKIQVVGNFNSWGFSGDIVGVDVAEVSFRDLRNNNVPDERVVYVGKDPTLHTMENKTFSIYQNLVEPIGNVLVGQKNVKLIQFSLYWSDGVAPGSVTFVAGQGSLANATNYTLLADYNYDGVWDSSVAGTVASKNGKLMFNFSKDIPAGISGALCEVHADITGGSYIQLVFPKSGSSITAVNMETGKFLRGVQVNGIGEGQIRLSQYPQCSPAYAIAQNPELFVKEIHSGSSYVHTEPGTKDVVLDVFSVFDANDVTVDYVAISAATGDLGYCVNYALWRDNDGDGNVDTIVSKGEMAWIENLRVVLFNNLGQSQAASESVRYEAHADVLDSVSPYAGIRTRLSGIGAKYSSGDPLPTDKVFLELSAQTYWYFYEDGGLG